MSKLRDKILVLFIILALLLLQFSNIAYALLEDSLAAWKTESGSTAKLGISFKQPDDRYYRITYQENGTSTSKTRAVYRTYYCDDGSSTKDYSKNIFCLDIDGKFPKENSTGTVVSDPDSVATVDYKSKGDFKENTTVNLTGQGKTLTQEKIKKILAILNKGYDYNTFNSENNTEFEKWLDDLISKYDQSDDPPSGHELVEAKTITKDKVFILEQVAIWEITNDFKLQNNLSFSTSTPTDLNDNQWQTEPGEHQKLAEAVVLNYFRDIAEKSEENKPVEKASFVKDSTSKTTKYIQGHVMIGPFKITNAKNISEVEVLGVKKGQDSETEKEEKITDAKFYKDQDGKTQISKIQDVTSDGFYLQIPITSATAYDSVKIKIKSKQKKMTLWENGTEESGSSHTFQPLVSVESEETEDNDTANIEKPNYDVALRKYIVQINGKDIATNKTDDTSREPDIAASTESDAFNKQDFQYKHKKDPVTVKPGDKVTYRIQVYNECNKTLVVSGITDYLPTGLKLASGDSINSNNWTSSNSNGVRSAVYHGQDLTLNPITTNDGAKQIYSMHVDIVCEVEAGVTNDRILTNVAEITQVEDENGNILTKENGLEDDSTGGNLDDATKKCPDEYKGESKEDDLTKKEHYYYGKEDDDDFEKLKVQSKGYNLDIEKVDSEGNTITSGQAKFKVTENNTDKTYTTSSGRAVIASEKELPENTDEYIIEEIEAPSGYQKTDVKIKVKVTKATTESGETKVSNIEVKVVNADGTEGEEKTVSEKSPVTIEPYTISLAGNSIQIKVKNEKVEGSYSVELEKVDESNNIITENTTFTINGETKTTENGRIILAQNKKITEENLEEYVIEEITPPNGYQKTDGKLKIKLNKEQKEIDDNLKAAEEDLSKTVEAYVISSVEATLNDDEANKQTINEGKSATLGSYEVSLSNGLITIRVKNKKEKKIFDLALKKFITKVMSPNGDGTFSETDYSGRCRTPDGSPLNSSQDAKYDLDKDVVKVKTGDTVIYTIRIFNEGDIDGTANIIADDLPEGLEFVTYSVDNDGKFISGSEINYKYGWKRITDDSGEHWKSGVYTEYLKGKNIKAYDKETNTLSSDEVQIELRVTATKSEVIKNIAEILDDTDDDRDSTPKDEVETEDDEDYDNIIPGGGFDLRLQKFITKIDDKEYTDRVPSVTYEEGQLKYAHPQDALVVVHGNKVTYTIRVYNEGEVAGFPSMVKDDLPDGITFLKDSETNKTYGWKMYKASENGEVTIGGKKYTEVQELSEAEIIATDYYSYEKATARGEKAIQPFDASKGIDGTNPDYRDLKVEFEVTAKNVAAENRIITNTAEIADDQDENGNPVEDVDSEPNNDKDGEDDIDKERLQLKYFDLSLLKYVSEVEVTEGGKKKTIKTDYDGTENPEPIVKVEIDKKKLNKTEVKYTFTIKITNEGEIEGYATEITDYIPSGLEFKAADNKEYNWKLKDGSKDVVTTDYLKDTLLKPGESATIKIVLRWKKSEKNLGQKINTAEISEDKNEYNAPDIDSTPDNKRNGEDDIDDAPVILSIKTGGTTFYVLLTISVLSILSVGGYLIYRYVYRPQEDVLIINDNYMHRRK